MERELPENELTENEIYMITDKWDETNNLRAELIKEKIDKTISKQDAELLEYLQALARARRRRIAPLPTEQELLDNIRQARELLQNTEQLIQTLLDTKSE